MLVGLTSTWVRPSTRRSIPRPCQLLQYIHITLYIYIVRVNWFERSTLWLQNHLDILIKLMLGLHIILRLQHLLLILDKTLSPHTLIQLSLYRHFDCQQIIYFDLIQPLQVSKTSLKFLNQSTINILCVLTHLPYQVLHPIQLITQLLLLLH